MIVVGLDPGSRHTGFGVVEQDGSRIRQLDAGEFSLVREPSMPARLARLAQGLEAMLERWRPAAAVLETPFLGAGRRRNIRSLIVLAQARGTILSVLGRRDLLVCEYSPAEVKQAVCGNGRAEKVQVARMVDVLLGPAPSKRSADASDALAVALCYVQRRPLERAVEAAGVRDGGGERVRGDRD